MFSNQNHNNEENNEEIYVNDSSRLQRIGLYISDTFDQTSFETVDFTDEEYNAHKNVQSQLLKTRGFPVHACRVSKNPTVLPEGFNSVQIISSSSGFGHDLIQSHSNPDGTQRSVYLMNDNMKMMARRKCVLQAEKKHKVESDEYHAVIVHEPETKIPRPPNAFMIFANEWRKKVAHKFNNESNKDISVRLGQMWRSLDKSRKEEYFVMARKADAEHKMKYPDYVYNPKEARLRKALRDSWKDKGKHTLQEQNRCIAGKSNTENWLSSQSTQNRKLLPMPSGSGMTFSMAADGYSMMETPTWSNPWYPYRHNSVPYLVPQISDSYSNYPNSNSNYSDRAFQQNNNHFNVQQSEVISSVINPCRSPFASNNEPEAAKEPLSQLQELANVFSSSDVPSVTRTAENESKDFPSSKLADTKYSNANRIKVEVETSINHDSDSGYVTDHPQQAEGAGQSNEFGKNMGKTGVSDVLMTENNGEPFIESFESNGSNTTNYINMDDVFLDCNFLSGDKSFGSNTSLDMADHGKNVLPGFQQAFGSTEIGRFSRNDFFTNPPADATTKNPTKTSKTESHPWNPNPNPNNYHGGSSDATTNASVDYFSDLCDLEESLLQSHPILAVAGEKDSRISGFKARKEVREPKNYDASNDSDPDFLNEEPRTVNSNDQNNRNSRSSNGRSINKKFNGRNYVLKQSRRESPVEKCGRQKTKASSTGGEFTFKGDELFDMLTTIIDDVDEFNVDELLVASSDKFNLKEVVQK